MKLCWRTSHHWGCNEFKEPQGTFLVQCISLVEGCKEIKLKINLCDCTHEFYWRQGKGRLDVIPFKFVFKFQKLSSLVFRRNWISRCKTPRLLLFFPCQKLYLKLSQTKQIQKSMKLTSCIHINHPCTCPENFTFAWQKWNFLTLPWP